MTTAEQIRQLKALLRETGGQIVAIDGAPVQSGEPSPKPRQPRQRQVAGDGGSKLELRFLDTWRMLCPEVELVREFMPVPDVARWRADFAVPALKIMVEVDGGTWEKGVKAHGYGSGATRDATKQNAATLAGWRVFRFTTDMLERRNIVGHVQPIVELVRRELAG